MLFGWILREGHALGRRELLVTTGCAAAPTSDSDAVPSLSPAKAVRPGATDSVIGDLARLPPGRYLPFAEFPGQPLPPNYETAFALLTPRQGAVVLLRTGEQVGGRIDFEIGGRCARAGLAIDARLVVTQEIVKALHAVHHASNTGAGATRSEVERLAFGLVEAAALQDASDIHLETRGAVARVFFRIHGERFEQPNLATATAMAILRVLYNVHADRQNTGTNWDPYAVQDTAVEHQLQSGQRVQLRFNSAPIYPAPNVQGTLRLLRMDGNPAVRDLDAVGYSPAMVSAIDDMLIGSSGLVLLVGPTNSGKSTSLQAFIQRIYQRRGPQIKVVTIEDPVEYVIGPACQMGIPRGKLAPDAIARIYRELLGSTLRQDPDVALVGEIRSSEQAEPVRDLVLAGRKILSTLHAYEALAVFPRLREIGISDSLLARPGFISGVIYQRLVPLLCRHCAIAASVAAASGVLPADTWQRVLQTLGPRSSEQIRCRCPAGCAHCNFTGIVGRTPCAELLVPDDEFLRLMRSGDEAGARRHWYRTGIDTGGAGVRAIAHAMAKMRDGLVDPADVEVQVGKIQPPLRNADVADAMNRRQLDAAPAADRNPADGCRSTAGELHLN